MSTEDSTSPRGLGAGAQSPMSRRLPGWLGFVLSGSRRHAPALTQQAAADHASGATASAERILKGAGFRRPVGERAGAIEAPHGPARRSWRLCGRLGARCEQPIV